MAQPVITVFGGTGFIGRHIIRRLAKEGAQIRVATRDVGKAHFLRPYGDIGQIQAFSYRQHPTQVFDEADVGRLLQGANAVINCVGILYPPSRQQSFEQVVHQFTAQLARQALKHEVQQFVQLSAIGADKTAKSLYAQAKGAAEEALRHNFPRASILAPSLVFGPEDDFFNRFARLARCLPVLPLIGGGHTRFQPAYVGDVADAVMAVLARSDSYGKRYELGGPRLYSLRRLLELVGEVTGRRVRFITIPFEIAKLQARLFELLPGAPLLTCDQVELLRHDNVVDAKALGFAELGISPTILESLLPLYLDQYRVGGRFRPVSRF
jgi:uncharacterized protein YbjT (DUF2867 family)